MKSTTLAFALLLSLSQQISAQTSTVMFLNDCRALVYGSGHAEAAENCRAMLEGALGAYGLLTGQYEPISAHLGYCIPPDTTPMEAAEVIVRFADETPECLTLTHFSMCMNMAFQTAYAGTC